MRLNENTVLEGKLVYLVPYREEHVMRYHEWMKSPELRILTASQELTLEEEFQMQKRWMDDNDKCTFIILWKRIYDDTQSIESMVGDTNIFLKRDESGDVAEVEVMIAEPSARGRGFGKEAVLLMLQYAILHLNVQTFRAIILEENIRSMYLFESIGFERVGVNRVFNEYIYEKKVCDRWVNYLKQATEKYIERELFKSSNRTSFNDLMKRGKKRPKRNIQRITSLVSKMLKLPVQV